MDDHRCYYSQIKQNDAKINIIIKNLYTYRSDCVLSENFHCVILFDLCDLNSNAHDIFWSNNQYLSIIALKDQTFIFFIFPSTSVHKFTLMAFYNVIRSSVLYLKKKLLCKLRITHVHLQFYCILCWKSIYWARCSHASKLGEHNKTGWEWVNPLSCEFQLKYLKFITAAWKKK